MQQWRCEGCEGEAQGCGIIDPDEVDQYGACRHCENQARRHTIADRLGAAKDDELEELPAIWAPVVTALGTLTTDDRGLPDFWGGGVRLLEISGVRPSLWLDIVDFWRAYRSELQHQLELIREQNRG